MMEAELRPKLNKIPLRLASKLTSERSIFRRRTLNKSECDITDLWLVNERSECLDKEYAIDFIYGNRIVEELIKSPGMRQNDHQN